MLAAGRMIHLEQHVRVSNNRNSDRHQRKRGKLTDPIPIHRNYEVGCGSFFTLSAIIVVSCIAP